MSLTDSLPLSHVLPPSLAPSEDFIQLSPSLWLPVVYDDEALRVIYILMLRNGRGWRDGRGGEQGRRETVGGLEKASSLNVSALN